MIDSRTFPRSGSTHVPAGSAACHGPGETSPPARHHCSDRGVSEVVGEMLMIALVVILVSVFSAALFSFLPAERVPSVSVMMTHDTQNVTLWHKGGDWVKADELSVIIGNDTMRTTWTKKGGNLALVPDRNVFSLGSNITVRADHAFEGNETIRLVTPRAVIFAGTVAP